MSKYYCKACGNIILNEEYCSRCKKEEEVVKLEEQMVCIGGDF